MHTLWCFYIWKMFNNFFCLFSLSLQANKIGLTPFFCHNGDHLTTPPPAHCGIPPYQIDPKMGEFLSPLITFYTQTVRVRSPSFVVVAPAIHHNHRNHCRNLFWISNFAQKKATTEKERCNLNNIKKGKWHAAIPRANKMYGASKCVFKSWSWVEFLNAAKKQANEMLRRGLLIFFLAVASRSRTFLFSIKKNAEIEVILKSRRKNIKAS